MNVQKILAGVQAPYLKKGLPKFRSGDTLKVHVKVVEGESERIQPFEGVVIRKQGSGLEEVFTVRKISFGIGIERTFPLHSPRIDKIEVMKSSHARRAKLYYLRKLSGKAARLTEKEQTSQEETLSAAPQDKAPEAKPLPQKKATPEPVVSH